MTVTEAGRMGGERTAAKYGPEHYERIGRMGGSKVKRLVEQGREAEREESEAWLKRES